MTSLILRSSGTGLRPTTASRGRTVRVRAIFGWGKSKESKEEEIDWKAVEREEQFQIQQDLREARKTGRYITEANTRRAKVAKTVGERAALRASEKESLAKGIIPDTLKDWKNYKKKEDAEGTGGVVIPLLPFGIKKFDEGERFDLRSPYSDMGWVDPDEVDMWSGLKKVGSKILNFSGNNDEYDKQYSKPILWASDYQKFKEDPVAWKAAQEAAKAAEVAAPKAAAAEEPEPEPEPEPESQPKKKFFSLF
ncbi:hypothetical protein FOA52_004336 [Chlamydomonas sp. UWO 241]|nr:hypothetical protein FOA52_004336 [Chlamydomonas sp. UWO 241]